MKILTKAHLLAELKKNKLPCSYLSLVRWEKDGTIPRPENTINYGRNKVRVYTEAEVASIIDIIKTR